MYDHDDDTRVLRFDFSAAEGHELAVVLETLLFAADPVIDAELLDRVYEKLGDEIHLAQWKREQVALDLTVPELIELNKALRRAGGSTLAGKFELTGELRSCLIATSSVDREYRPSDWT